MEALIIDVAAERERAIAARGGKLQNDLMRSRARMILEFHWNASREELAERIREKYKHYDEAAAAELLEATVHVQMTERPKIDRSTITVRPPEPDRPLPRTRSHGATVDTNETTVEAQPAESRTPAKAKRGDLRKDKALREKVYQIYERLAKENPEVKAAAVQATALDELGVELSYNQAVWMIHSKRGRTVNGRPEPKTRSGPPRRRPLHTNPPAQAPAVTAEQKDPLPAPPPSPNGSRRPDPVQRRDTPPVPVKEVIPDSELQLEVGEGMRGYGMLCVDQKWDVVINHRRTFDNRREAALYLIKMLSAACGV